MELHQSPQYQTYMRLLKWDVDPIENEFVYSKAIPFIGRIAKLQRWTSLPAIDKLITVLKEKKVAKVALEPAPHLDSTIFTQYVKTLQSAGFVINSSPFLATKTIHIPLTSTQTIIFNNFSQVKRRAVRRAEKNNLLVRESQDIEALIRTKNASAGLLGSMTTYGIRELWKAFYPNATCVLAFEKTHNNPIGGVLLLYCDRVAYYWIAGATAKGKKLFAPTLLVWEALKISKAAGNTMFDFVGIWDDRRPNQSKDWLGFTKFKLGFGGNVVYYPLSS